MNSYIGQTPVFGDFPFEILSGDGTSFYELNFKTNGTNGLLVFLNGAVQRPGIDFTCDGNALTFSENVSVGVQIFVYGMGLPKSSLAPSAGSVGLAEISNEIRAFDGDAQDWTNLLKFLTPKGLDDSLKGSNQSLAANGYQKLPGGLIIQWGTALASIEGNSVNYPISFPNNGFCIMVSGGNNNDVPVTAYLPTLTSFTANAVAGTGGPYSFYFVAFGY